MNVDPYYQRQKFRSITVVSGNIHCKSCADIRRRFLLGRLQTCVRSLKSTNLPFSRCRRRVSYRNNVGINCTLRQQTILDFCRWRAIESPPRKVLKSALPSQVSVGRLFTRGRFRNTHYGGFVAVGERSSWGGRDYHNGGDYFPLEQCLPPEDILRGRHNSVTPAPIRMTLNDLECPIQLKMRMSHSHGLLADSVDTSLAIYMYR